MKYSIHNHTVTDNIFDITIDNFLFLKNKGSLDDNMLKKGAEFQSIIKPSLNTFHRITVNFVFLLWSHPNAFEEIDELISTSHRHYNTIE